MKYTSTRDSAVSVDSATAVINGISSEGGLFVPETLPKIDWHSLLKLDYAGRVETVLGEFFDFDISGIAKAAYDSFDGDPAPVVKLDDDLFVLELWHGATHAFKDMALSVLPRLIPRAKAALGRTETTLILVATSGDTGKAALEGFKDVDGTSVCVFYPTDGVSAVQKLAMQTQEGGNVLAVGITGNFDDAQTAVKRAFADPALVEKLKANGVVLSSANSINIGRLVPQIAYYFSAYCDLVNDGEIEPGDKIDFVVPTGNFGNILAGWYAMQMGLPINKLVCASNRNNVLTDFIETGSYDVNREFFKTESPSMDILVSSNLERLLFEISGRDSKSVKLRMAELGSSGRYSVTVAEMGRIQDAFASGSADSDDTEEAISYMFDEYGYLIDTHTAVAASVAFEREITRPTVVVSTANPYKFAVAVLRALGERVADEVTEKTLDKLEELSAMDAPESIRSLFKAQPRFCEVVAPADIIAFIGERFGA